MQEKHKTYTYTARSVNNPDNVVTFTLDNEHLRVNLTGVLDQASTLIGAEEKKSEIGYQLSKQTKPIVTKMMENFSGPVHVSDVQADFNGERLRLTFWQRTAGLRLAPIIFCMGKVDNVDAAGAFVDELNERKAQTKPVRKFFGPLDYWIGWVGLSFLILYLLRRPGDGEQAQDHKV
jgi:hypothetical protein